MEIFYIKNPHQKKEWIPFSRMFHPSFFQMKKKNSRKISSSQNFHFTHSSKKKFLCVCYPNLLFLLTSVLHLSPHFFPFFLFMYIFFFSLSARVREKERIFFSPFPFFFLLRICDFFSLTIIWYKIHSKPTETIGKCTLIA